MRNKAKSDLRKVVRGVLHSDGAVALRNNSLVRNAVDTCYQLTITAQEVRTIVSEEVAKYIEEWRRD